MLYNILMLLCLLLMVGSIVFLFLRLKRLTSIMSAKDTTLANLREAYKNLEATKPLRELGQSVAFINHEIKNYMMVISGYTTLLLRSKTLGERDRAMIDNIAQTAAKMHDLNTGVLEQSKSNITHDNKEFDLTQKLNSSIDTYFPKLAHKFDCRCAAPDGVLLINGSPEKIELCFAGAFRNSFEAAAQKIRAKLYIYNYMALAVIEDDGNGCNAEQLENLSNTFFTTKQSVDGMGIGFCTIRSIIEMHNGSVSIYSKNLLGGNNRGMSVQIAIPASKRTPYSAARSDIMLVQSGFQNTVAAGVLKILKNMNIIPHIVGKPKDADFESRSTELDLVVLAAASQTAELKVKAGDNPKIKIFAIEAEKNRTLFIKNIVAVEDDENKDDKQTSMDLLTEEYIVRSLSGEIK